MLKRVSAMVATVAFLTFNNAALAANEKGDFLYVKVRESKVRTEASHLAPAVTSLRYGDSVTKLSSDEKGWFKVQAGGKGVGYLHASAVTPRKVVLGAGKKGSVEADRSEYVMAGKGFSLEVEKQYATANSELNFAAVNRMERIVVTDKDLRTFAKEGQLAAAGGR